jgi:glycosyltransferase involved in cell wall biosynthesis
MRLKLVEFFAAGKAVVSTTIGAEGNVARNNEHLLIRDDPSAFALAVVELLANRQRRTELGAAARELALEVYGWQSIAERFVQLYERVLLEKSRV